MTKVAFLGYSYSRDWMGGVNYMSNLFFAISRLKDRSIEPIVFLGTNTDLLVIEKLNPHVKIIQNSLFDKKSVKWYISKILEKVFGNNFLVERVLLKHEISVISHSNIINGYKNFIKINWITDFQHLHFPDFFSADEQKRRNRNFLNIMQESDRVIVSSYNAFEDAQNFYSNHDSKLKILQFTSQLPNEAAFFSFKNISRIQRRYDFEGKYFYLPNQFWKHKNHMLIFRAVKLLKDDGINVLVICSGYMNDYREPKYIEEINLYLTQNKLNENVKLLGLIEYNDVLRLMMYSLAVINPSLFEGWSSSVEECKSMGKEMILSDLAIHREQNPSNTFYFDSGNVDEVAALLKRSWEEGDAFEGNKKVEQKVLDNLDKRTFDFALKYQNIVEDAVKSC
jgi:glycosyltransferase involved in cell wall biosynthesis